jgi:sugar O-acyltransferase (sialic acid O-acetyltransferase NeuD family)
LKENYDLAIIGSSEFGVQVASYATEAGWNIVGYYDDYKTAGVDASGNKILGNINSINSHFIQNRFSHLFIAIGYSHLSYKTQLYNQYKQLIPFANIFHHSVIIGSNVKLGEGILIHPGAIIDNNCILGSNVVVNTGSILAHDVEIGGSTFIAPGVTIAGFCNVGENSFIGAGSTVKNNINIFPNITVGAGSVVTKDLTCKESIYIGSPARVMIDKNPKTE